MFGDRFIKLTNHLQKIALLHPVQLKVYGLKNEPVVSQTFTEINFANLYTVRLRIKNRILSYQTILVKLNINYLLVRNVHSCCYLL